MGDEVDMATMAPEELRAARESLGLSASEAAAVLDTDSSTIRKIELPHDAPTHRGPPVRVVRLYRAYLDGWRPRDWPARLVERERNRAELEEVRTDGQG